MTQDQPTDHPQSIETPSHPEPSRGPLAWLALYVTRRRPEKIIVDALVAHLLVALCSFIYATVLVEQTSAWNGPFGRLYRVVAGLATLGYNLVYSFSFASYR